MPVDTNRIRACCPLLPEPAPAVVKELCDALDLQRQELHAVEYMLCKRLGGTVEGQPTAEINYLQRVDELVRKEKESEAAIARATAEQTHRVHDMQNRMEVAEEKLVRLEQWFTEVCGRLCKAAGVDWDTLATEEPSIEDMEEVIAQETAGALVAEGDRVAKQFETIHAQLVHERDAAVYNFEKQERELKELHVERGSWGETLDETLAKLARALGERDDLRKTLRDLWRLNDALGTIDIVQIVALMQCILADLDTYTTEVAIEDGPGAPVAREVRARARATLAALNNSGLV